MTIITQQQVKDAFSKAGVGNQNLGLATIDDVMPRFRVQTYAALKEDWILNDYVLWFNNLLSTWEVKWEDFFNCEAFTQVFCAMMRISYLREVAGQSDAAQAPACFESWGGNYPGVTGEHAVIAAITENGPVWIEPQPSPAVKVYPMQAVNADAINYIL